MKTIAQFVRTTIVGGLLFLAPIVVLIIILAKAFDYAKKVLNAFVVHIPAVSHLSAGVATAGGRARRARLLCSRDARTHRTCAACRQRTGVVGAIEDSGLRVPETGERKRAGGRPEHRPPRSLRTHGRGMATRPSNRTGG